MKEKGTEGERGFGKMDLVIEEDGAAGGKVKDACILEGVLEAGLEGTRGVGGEERLVAREGRGGMAETEGQGAVVEAEGRGVVETTEEITKNCLIKMACVILYGLGSSSHFRLAILQVDHPTPIYTEGDLSTTSEVFFAFI